MTSAVAADWLTFDVSVGRVPMAGPSVLWWIAITQSREGAIHAMSGPHQVSDALTARAERVIPGGMWAHQHNRFLTPDHPMFVESSEGPFLTDVAGSST